VGIITGDLTTLSVDAIVTIAQKECTTQAEWTVQFIGPQDPPSWRNTKPWKLSKRAPQ
tara:strand:+ start:401 stop:574 length:174 start_codon:yes stop_codon:yes gene_type:complete